MTEYRYYPEIRPDNQTVYCPTPSKVISDVVAQIFRPDLIGISYHILSDLKSECLTVGSVVRK